MFKAAGHSCCSTRHTAQCWSPPAGSGGIPPSTWTAPRFTLPQSNISFPQALLFLHSEPLRSCVEVCCCSPAQHSPCRADIDGFFSACQGYSPKLELAEHLHLRNTVIFPPSSWAWRKWSRDTTTFPDRKYLAHIPHAMSILNQSHSYFCAISFCSSFCFPTIYSTHI